MGRSCIEKFSLDQLANCGRVERADGADGAKAAGLPAFPWGPSIAVACWLCMLFGQQVINWYLGLFL
jgi:hypothetical protein